MDLLRFSQDVFGQKMLVGMNWDLLWLPLAAAAVVIVLHMLFRILSKAG